ncbi:MAG TPA: nitrilase-related carbon-nitrogen hydrolase [Paludibacteraceae bacterium]|nr:nitrilase-related carbon-nitrogen hydrolase [Paludibacteraceae bacterium]
MQLSLVQQRIVWGDKVKNLATFEAEAKAHYGKTDLLVLPEMFSTGFCADKIELAESVDGETISTVKRWAKEGDFAIVGSFMCADSGKLYNRAFFCQPNGCIDYADKRHLFVGFEQRFFTQGNQLLDVTFRGVKFRLLVCFDVRFPVWSRNASGYDYDVLLYVANWPKDRIDAWDALLKARAIENQAYVCGVNVVGEDAYGFHHNGHSALLDMYGRQIVTFFDDETATKTGKIDLAKLNRLREKFMFWQSNDKFQIKE